MKSQKTSELNYANVDINEMVKTLAEQRDQILTDFSKAYLAESGALPSEVELVSVQTKEGTTIETTYFFRKKNA